MKRSERLGDPPPSSEKGLSFSLLPPQQEVGTGPQKKDKLVVVGGGGDGGSRRSTGWNTELERWL